METHSRPRPLSAGQWAVIAFLAALVLGGTLRPLTPIGFAVVLAAVPVLLACFYLGRWLTHRASTRVLAAFYSVLVVAAAAVQFLWLPAIAPLLHPHFSL